MSEITVGEIAAMELFRGHQIPAEYQNPMYCAVIALWSR